jgi:hypothetical protein
MTAALVVGAEVLAPAGVGGLAEERRDAQGDLCENSALRQDRAVFHLNLPPESETRANDHFSTIFDFKGT